MNTTDNLHNLLDFVRESAISLVDFDDEAILAEYKRQDDNQSSTAIKILTVVGGFFATLAFLGFLALADLFDSEIMILIIGLVLVVVSVLLNKKSDKLIFDTFSISTYILGGVLIVIGLTSLGLDENSTTIIAMLIAGVSLYLTQNYILSFISFLGISIGLLILLVFLNETYNLIHLYNTIIVLAMTYVFLFEAKIIHFSSKLSRLYNPLRVSLILSFLVGLFYLRTRHIHELPVNTIWFYAIVLFGILLFMISKILNLMEVTQLKTKIVVYTMSAVLLVVTTFSPSILGAILLVLLGFYVNSRFSFVVGILALIYFVSQYYYDLNYTLLTKSYILLVSGFLFIALYLFTSKAIKNEKI